MMHVKTAALYVGSGQDPFRLSILKSLEEVVDDFGPHDRGGIVSASLGSTITLRTLIRAIRHPSWCTRNGCSHVTLDKLSLLLVNQIPFYMFANQWPLLDPASSSESADSRKSLRSRESPGLDSLAQQLVDTLEESRPRRTSMKLDLLAFTEPNDLLSYPISVVQGSGQTQVRIINAYGRNPGLTLGVFRSPLSAHTAYDRNPAVIKLMAEGFQPSVDPHPQPAR